MWGLYANYAASDVASINDRGYMRNPWEFQLSQIRAWIIPVCTALQALPFENSEKR